MPTYLIRLSEMTAPITFSKFVEEEIGSLISQSNGQGGTVIANFAVHVFDDDGENKFPEIIRKKLWGAFRRSPSLVERIPPDMYISVDKLNSVSGLYMASITSTGVGVKA